MQGKLPFFAWGLLLMTTALATTTHALSPDQIAILVNEQSEDSKQLGAYYANARGIPAANIIRVKTDPERSVIPSGEFTKIRESVIATTPENVQAYAVAWQTPYRVGCMSLTSALAFGFDKSHCASGCKPTAASELFDHDTRQPFTDLGLRPTMMLTANSLDGAKALVDRGVRSDFTKPIGAAYLVETTDKYRNTRAPTFSIAQLAHQKKIRVALIKSAGIRGRYDVLFYFTGSKRVPHLDTLGFLPGAMADHLTSSGGVLNGRLQMSALEWIKAGATGTFGTVIEPCNFRQKFPEPTIAMKFYLDGETLIESYWKSVQWPGQGLFVGEPLARPFADRRSSVEPPPTK